MPLSRLCVFAGTGEGAHDDYRRTVASLGAELVRRNISLVYGGASVGLMGVLADAVLAGGGEVVGVIPKALMRSEIGHGGLAELHVVDSMHERKALMARLADAFVAVPGGLGTLEELLEVATWTQLGLHAKPVGVLDVRGYYDPLMRVLDHAVSEGFLTPKHREVIAFEDDPGRLLDLLDRWEMPIAKWDGPPLPAQ
jgi:uncharacterized protein (TIGR00730 family)